MMERAEQKQKVYEVYSTEVGKLVQELVDEGEWEGEPVPPHIMAISISAHAEEGPRIGGMLQISVVYVALE